MIEISLVKRSRIAKRHTPVISVNLNEDMKICVVGVIRKQGDKTTKVLYLLTTVRSQSGKRTQTSDSSTGANWYRVVH